MKVLSLLLPVLLFVSCRQAAVRQEAVLQAGRSKAMDNRFAGAWRYSFPFYSSILTLHGDSTFDFYARGCLGRCYTAGTWSVYGNNLLLTSDERFRPGQTGADTGNDVSSPTHVSYDSSALYFAHTRLYLSGDTLYERNDLGIMTSTHYSRGPASPLP